MLMITVYVHLVKGHVFQIPIKGTVDCQSTWEDFAVFELLIFTIRWQDLPLERYLGHSRQKKNSAIQQFLFKRYSYFTNSTVNEAFARRNLDV